jgi:hypothetical protein
MRNEQITTKRDLALARVCLSCPVCRHARKHQKGLAFWLTSKVETQLCPFCRAYERVYGRKAHQVASDGTAARPRRRHQLF